MNAQPGALRQRLVEQVMQRRAIAGAVVEPVEQASSWRYTCTSTCPSSTRVVQRRQRRRRRATEHVALHVEHAAVAGTEDALRLAVVGGAAAEMRAGRLQRAHVLLAGTHEVDDRAIDDLRVAVLRVTRSVTGTGWFSGSESSSAARSHVSSRREKLGASVVAPRMNASVAPIVA